MTHLSSCRTGSSFGAQTTWSLDPSGIENLPSWEVNFDPCAVSTQSDLMDSTHPPGEAKSDIIESLKQES